MRKPIRTRSRTLPVSRSGQGKFCAAARRLLLSAALLSCILPHALGADSAALSFHDVPEASWFHASVAYVCQNDLMSGISDTEFAPHAETTRGMIVTVLHRMEGAPPAATGAFPDVPAYRWYRDAVSWASGQGIVSGYADGRFGPEDPITREQLAVILYRYASCQGQSAVPSGSLSGFSDSAQVRAYAQDAFRWAVGNGLISGFGQPDRLAPQASVTRVQLASILMRYHENSTGNAPDPEPQEKTYLITFDTNDGARRDPRIQAVPSGETADKPASPSRRGHTFDGWYTSKSGGRSFDFSEKITSDLTLYAHWSITGAGRGGSPSVAEERAEPEETPETEDTSDAPVIPAAPGASQSCTVTYDSQGGEPVAPQTVGMNQPFTEPEEPEKDGCLFLGWLDDDQNYFEFDEAANRDITLTADWLAMDGPDEAPPILGPLPEPSSGRGSATTVEQPLTGGPVTKVSVTCTLDSTGKVSVSPLTSGPMLRTAGLLGAAEISAAGAGVREAEITFSYDPGRLRARGIDPEALAIVWYDTENNSMVLLDGTTDPDAGTISVETSHFSQYAVVDGQAWQAAWARRLPALRTEAVPYYSIVLAMDCSGSMFGEKRTQSVKAAQNLIDVLADEDRITLLFFEERTYELLDEQQLVTEQDHRDDIKGEIDRLYADGGTEIAEVLVQSLSYKSRDPQYQSLVILLSDGQSFVPEETLEALRENGQRVITVGIGSDVDQTMMEEIAEATGGSYLFCATADDLADAFRQLQDTYIGSTDDSDGDGLPDAVETQGMRDQYGEIWTTDPNDPDSDGDGYSDGEEMGAYQVSAQQPYFQRLSRPDLYTVMSDEAYLLMPERMMYSVDTADNRLELVVYVIDGAYRMVPDLTNPADPDGIPKEYLYSPPKNLKVELSGLPDGVVIDRLETVPEGVLSGSLASSYKTTAILSYTKPVVLEEVTWTVTADNCSEWSGYTENGIRLNYIQKQQPVQDTKLPRQEVVTPTDQARLYLAQKANDLVQKLYRRANAASAGTADSSRSRIRSMIHLTPCHSRDVLPDGLYDAFAMALVDAMSGSKIDVYETDMNKLTKQIAKQLDKGLSSGISTQVIDGIQYDVNCSIAAQGGLGVGWQTISWRAKGQSHQVTLTWENVSSKEGRQALAEYCAALAQLNQGVWRDFLAYYVSDSFGLLGITAVTKDDVDKVLQAAEKTIYALCDKKAADQLAAEMGGAAGEQLKSGISNHLKKFVKDRVPHGNTLVKAAETYKKAKKEYTKFEKAWREDAGSKKTAKTYQKLEQLLQQMERLLQSV